MMLVCLECPGEQCCTLQMPDCRKHIPIICKSPDEIMIIVPKWMEVPKKENVYQDPLDRPME
jgi:hypothetical protein